MEYEAEEEASLEEEGEEYMSPLIGRGRMPVASSEVPTNPETGMLEIV